MRGGTLQLNDEVRVGDRLAEFLGADRARGRRAARRPDPLDASHGGHLCTMRRPSGPCVIRRTAADGGSLLHELGLAGTRAGAALGVGDRPEPPGSGFSPFVAHRPWTIAASGSHPRTSPGRKPTVDLTVVRI